MSTTATTPLTAQQIKAMTPAQIAAQTAAQINALSAAAIANLTVADMAAMSPSLVAGFSAATIHALSATQIGALSATAAQSLNVAALTTTQLAAITATTFSVFTAAQVLSLSAAQLAVLSKTEISDLNAILAKAVTTLSASQIQSLTIAEIAAASAATLGGLTAGQIGAASAAQIGAISSSAISGLSRSAVAALNSTQVAGMTAAQLNALTVAQLQALKIASLSASQLSGLTAATIGNLTVSQFDAAVAPSFASLTTAQRAGVTASEIASLTPAQLGTLSVTALNGLSAAQWGAVSATAAHGLTAAQLNGLNATALGAINPADFSATQIGEFTATAIAAMSVKTFDAIFASQLASISASAISGLTAADLNSLTSAQLATFTAAQIADMSAAQKAYLPASTVQGDVTRLESGGALSYASMVTLLDDAATGGMTAAKFQSLETLAGELNVSGGISTTAYVQQIFDDVVLGNTANAYWNGGSSSAVALGNLSATSSTTQVNELIGKWFLGTDMPSANIAAVNGSNIATSYAAVNLPLFTAAGPKATDVNQGDLGDCYFLSALGEVAMQDPSLISSMIQSNGNNTWSVEFWINGKADYVTVNNELPLMTGGQSYAGGAKELFANTTTSLWVPLVEKAYAQLMEQTSVTPGEQLGLHGDAYEDTSSGWAWSLTELTGQNYNSYSLYSGEASSTISSILGTLQSAFAAGQELLMGTSGQAVASGSNLVADHMFMVSGVNASAGTVSLMNPWGANVPSGMQSSFTTSIANLVADGATLFTTTGKAAAA